MLPLRRDEFGVHAGALAVKPGYSKAGRDDLAVLFSAGAIGSWSDAELLSRFTRGKGEALAEAVFATLVDRHGPLVLGVCRRVTGDWHSADDAFQAVFLVLARKAHSVRLEPDDSLSRWLHGVSLRVARRVRAVTAKQTLGARDFQGLDPIDPSRHFDPCEQADRRAEIDAEIARLPARQRSAVVLCDLEGLSREQAARRLRCPIGTLQSRLHRARERLRSGLARRGLAPSTATLVEALGRPSKAAMPSDLGKETAAAAARLSAGGTLSGAAPAAVAGLAQFYLKSIIMKKLMTIAGLIVLTLATTGGALGLATGQDDPPKTVAQGATKTKAQAPDPPLAEQLDRLKAEYETAQRAYFSLYKGSTIPQENLAKAAEIAPDYSAVVRRIDELAATDPKNPAGRDALIWVILNGLSGSDHGPQAGEYSLAASRLIHKHGDDPEAVRVGLSLDTAPSLHRDYLLLGFYASAKGREARGLARLALARYLQRKAMMAEYAHKTKTRPIYTHNDVVRADGTLYTVTETQPDEDYAYHLHLKQCDASFLRDEAERLSEEVIAEYGDIPFVTARDRQLESLIERPDPQWNGRPLDDEGRRAIKARLSRRQTLGQVAEAQLDDWRNLAVGKMAPEIEGVDLLGKPLKLSDYRGKVVAMVFWGAWCGPCVRQIPHEKALVDRMKGRPFAMLGVNTDTLPETALKLMEAQGVTWPNWRDGEPGEGPIAKLYHVRGYPTTFVIDADGKIRSKATQGEALDRLVESLVAEREAARD